MAPRASRTRRGVTSRAGSSPTTPPTRSRFTSSPRPGVSRQLAVWTAVAVPAGTPNHDIGTHPLPATGPVRDRQRHAARGHARPQPLLSRVVTRGTAGRLPRPRSCGGSAPAPKQRSRPSSAAAPTTRSTAPPADRLSEVQTRFASQLKVNPNDVTILSGPQHEGGAVQRPSGAPSAQLRDRPRQAGNAVGTGLPPHLPDAPTLHTRLSALLPLHAQPKHAPGLERARPRQGPGPDRGLGHPRHADHDLEPAALRCI